jgi:hypothetical protein
MTVAPAASRQMEQSPPSSVTLITMNWRGKPLVSHQVIFRLIGSATTETDLKVCCEIDANKYSRGINVANPDSRISEVVTQE